MPIYNTRIAPSIGGLSIGAYRLLSNGLPPSFYPEPLGAVMQKLTPFFPGCWTPNNFWAQCGMGDQVQAADGMGVWPPRGPAISIGAVPHTAGPMAAAVNPKTASSVSALLPKGSGPKQPQSDPIWDLFYQLADRWPLISAGYENQLCLFTICATWVRMPIGVSDTPWSTPPNGRYGSKPMSNSMPACRRLCPDRVEQNTP